MIQFSVCSPVDRSRFFSGWDVILHFSALDSDQIEEIVNSVAERIKILKLLDFFFLSIDSLIDGMQ